MPGVAKISALSAFSAFADGDLFVGVDISDTTLAPTGTDKKLTLAQLRAALSPPVTGITAAGTNQGTATALTGETNNVTTVASGTGVIIPAFGSVGVKFTVRNSGANALLVYPPSSTQINSLGNNVGYIIPPGSTQTFIWVSSTLLLATQVLMAGGTIATAETQAAAAAYGDLATVGPAVTLTTGSEVYVFLTCGMLKSSTSNFAYMSFAVSGATTRAANDNDAAVMGSAVANIGATVGAVLLITGLTPGANTFTCKYHNDGGTTWTFNRRSILVIPKN